MPDIDELESVKAMMDVIGKMDDLDHRSLMIACVLVELTVKQVVKLVVWRCRFPINPAKIADMICRYYMAEIAVQ